MNCEGREGGRTEHRERSGCSHRRLWPTLGSSKAVRLFQLFLVGIFSHGKLLKGRLVGQTTAPTAAVAHLGA